ncbi:MAG TPA: hypothetical protein VMW62_14790 [Chloroflexota bacterium]|nr:hypothetical protein [Chloroflexota bacterium]
MDQPLETNRTAGARLVVFGAIAVGLVLILGAGAKLAHTATIPNGGMPVSNSKSLPNLSAYDPQVEVTKQYLLALTSLNYSAAYQLLAPSVRAGLTPAQFEADRRAEGVLGQPAVWADDSSSTRAEYVLGKPDGSSDTRRHRFALQQEGGRWWVDRETPLDTSLPAAPNLSAAMHQFVLQRAGHVWVNSVELLRQEGFEGGQLLLFSYIEPRPAGILTAERLAVLTYYKDQGDGWHFQGGGSYGLAAGMNMADVSLGFTAFGPDQQYTAYYGVVENTNAVTLAFVEPNGARHSQNVKGQRTVLFLNERNPFEQLPFRQPFNSISVKDAYGNTLRTNPESPPPS